MAELTKKDLEAILDTKFEQYQKSIIEASDFKFEKVDGRFEKLENRIGGLEGKIDQRLGKIEYDISELRAEIRNLAVTLDNFVKMMTDYKEKFIILKGEVDKIKSFIKEKFGVEIAVQG